MKKINITFGETLCMTINVPFISYRSQSRDSMYKTITSMLAVLPTSNPLFVLNYTIDQIVYCCSKGVGICFAIVLVSIHLLFV